MSKLILGTVQFGLDYGINNALGQTAEEEAFKILDFAYQNGINRLDTAANYGNSEAILGKYFKSNPTKKFEVITKFNLLNKTCEESLILSLSKLHIKSINSIMFHSFLDYQNSKDQIEFLNKNYKGKFFQKLGVSVYTNDQILAVLEDSDIDLIQAPFNLLDNHSLRGEVFQKVKDTGKELHTRSVFLQGLFFKDVDLFPENLRSLIPAIQSIKDLAIKSQVSLNDLALAYVCSKSYIDGVLFGVDNLVHMKHNLLGSSTILSDEVINQIDSIKIANIHLLNPSVW